MPVPIESLAGRAIRASIGEPWDFESSAGANKLDGRIVAVARLGRGSAVLREVSPFSLEAVSISRVVARARYVGEDAATLLARGERVPVNLSYPRSGRVVTDCELATFPTKEHGDVGWIIGAIWVVYQR